MEIADPTRPREMNMYPTCLYQVIGRVFLFVLMVALPAGYGGAQPFTTFHAFRTAFDDADMGGISGLVDGGFDVNMKDVDGRTALLYAAANGKDEEFAVKVIGMLLSRGADVNGEDSFGRTAIVYAIEEDRRMLAAFLLDHGADVTMQCAAYRMPVIFVPFLHGREVLVRMMISKCGNVDVRDSLGNTTLSWVARLGYLDAAKMLLGAGADINNRSKYNKTPLMEAAEKGYGEIVILLVKAGADVNIRTSKGWSALMWASEKGYTPIVSVLIKAGADLFAVNGKGERALTIAKRNNHVETAKVIEAAEFRVYLKRAGFFGAVILALSVLVIFMVRRISVRRLRRFR